MRNLLIIIPLLILLSCNNTEHKRQQFTAYFDVDSLLNAQLSLFSAKNVRIIKSAELEGNNDSTSYTADSLSLAQELNAFRKANINIPALEGQYQEIKLDKDGKQIIKYSTKGDASDLEVKYLQLVYKNDRLKSLEAHVEEDHWLYTSRRILNLDFNNEESNQITHYTINGTQKMILRDRVDFIVDGSIITSDPHLK